MQRSEAVIYKHKHRLTRPLTAVPPLFTSALRLRAGERGEQQQDLWVLPDVPEGRRRPAPRYRRPGMVTYEVYKHSQPHRSIPHAHPGPRSSSRMHGLKPRLHGVHTATLPACVRGFALGCHCMGVVRAIGSRCRKPLMNIARRQTHLRKHQNGPLFWPLGSRQST